MEGTDVSSQACDEAVYTLAATHFDVTVLRNERQRQEKLINKFQKQLDEGMTGVEADRLRRYKADLDCTVSDLVRKIQRLEAAHKSASALYGQALQGSREKPSEVRSGMKQAVVDLAMKVDPKGSGCAICLGKLWLRTPHFFLESDLVGNGRSQLKARAARAAVSISPKEETVPLPDPAVLEPWKMFEMIDELVEKAAEQQEGAIEQLLAWLASETLQQQWRHHLIRMVMDKVALVESRDQVLMAETGRRCAVTAHWARRAAGGDPGGSPYALVQKIAEEEAAYSTAETSPECRTRTSGRTGMEQFLQRVERNFLEMCHEDALLHVTPQVADTLQRLSRAGLEQLRQEEMTLYGHPELQTEELHWFARRKAAFNVCELTSHGNSLAFGLISSKLLRESEHWTVRQVVVDEICRMLVQMTPDHPFFCDLVEQISLVLFKLPVADKRGKQRRAVDKSEQLLRMAIGNVQRTAETRLVQELKGAKAELRSAVAQELARRCDAQGDKLAVLDRVVRAVGGLQQQAQSPQLHKPTMKWHRERQREMDLAVR